MPTYDYLCEACGHELEIFQSMTESPKRKCPRCGRLKLARQFGTGGGILFRGSGFHQTDYRSESYKRAAKADTEPKPPETPKKKDSGGTSSEAKAG